MLPPPGTEPPTRESHPSMEAPAVLRSNQLSYLPVLRPLRLLVRFEGDLGGRIRAPTTTKLAAGSKWDGRRFQWLLPPAWPVQSLLRQPAGSCFINNIVFQDLAGSEARPLRNGWFCCMFNCQFSPSHRGGVTSVHSRLPLFLLSFSCFHHPAPFLVFSAANLALVGFPLTNALGENLPSHH